MTIDPNQRYAKGTISVAPSPATTGTSTSIDVGTADPFANVVAPYYASIKPSATDPHQGNAETVLVTAAAAGTRVGSVLIEVLQEGSPGQGAVQIDTVQQGGDGNNEQQSVVVTADGGTYKLSFKGVLTAALAYNANDAAIAAALNAIASISAFATVTITEVAVGGAGPPSVNAKQQLTVVASAGTYTLSFDGQTTGAIAWNAADATIKTPLEGLSTIGTGNVDVTGGLVTFQGDLAATPVPLLIADTTLLTGSGSVTVTGGVVTFNGGLLANQNVDTLGFDVSTLTYSVSGKDEIVLVTVNADAGNYTLTFGGNTTTALGQGASSGVVQAALRLLASIGGNNVNVTGASGGPFTIEFVGTLANTNVGAITADASLLTLNTRVFSPITRAQKGSTARSVVVGDTIEVATLPDKNMVSVNLAGATVNDWNPSGLAPDSTLLVSGGGTINGMANGADGRRRAIANVDASATLVIWRENTGSLAANRMTWQAGTDYIFLLPGQASQFEYDVASARWRSLDAFGLHAGDDVVAIQQAGSDVPVLTLRSSSGLGGSSAVAFVNRSRSGGFDNPAFTVKDSTATTIFSADKGGPTVPTQAAGDNSDKVATTAYVDRVAGGAVQSVSSAVTLVDGSAGIVEYDTTGGAFTITLPAAPTTGSRFLFINTGGSANQLTIGRNGKNIDGVAGDLAFNVAKVVRGLVYDGTGWRSFSVFRQTPATLTYRDPTSATPNSEANIGPNAFTYFAESATTAGTIAVGTQGARTTGTAAAGFGGRLILNIEDAAGADIEAVRFEWYWETATAGATDSGCKVYTRIGGAEAARWNFKMGEFLGIHAASAMGYGVGTGGTVTQLTSKATGVTLNVINGQITMNGAALAANTTVSFVLTDSAIKAGDVLILNHISGGTPGSYLLNARSAAGSATIDVRNVTPGSLSEAIVIAFAVIRAATS